MPKLSKKTLSLVCIAPLMMSLSLVASQKLGAPDVLAGMLAGVGIGLSLLAVIRHNRAV